MPSRFEPCGLNQMFSQLNGTIPIVHRTGGLNDSVIDLTDDPEFATGIKFAPCDKNALASAIFKGIVLFKSPELLAAFRRNCMKADFGWERVTEAYLNVYQSLFASC